MRFVEIFAPILLPVTIALEIIDVLVPRYAELRQTAELGCDFDVGRGKLYSVKWYKDDHEFYRFVPDDRPNVRVFRQTGIALDLYHCNMKKITLSNLTLQNSGTYRCEVSTDGPKFEMVFKSANMTVLAYPEGNPSIEGVLNHYAVGDLVSGNCTSTKSYPQPIMTWYINGVQAKKNQLVNYPVHVNPEGPLYSKSVGLHFKVEKNHFQGPEENLDLTCEASLVQGQLKWRKMIVIQSLARFYTENMFLEKYRSNISANKPGKQLSTLIALLVVSYTHVFVHKT